MNKLDKYIIVNYVKSFILGMMMFFLIFLLAESISLTGWLMDGKMKGGDVRKPFMYKQNGKTIRNCSDENKWDKFCKDSIISHNFFISSKFRCFLFKL